MGFVSAPNITLALFAIVGVLIGGLPGLLIGLVLGVAFNLLVGGLVRWRRGWLSLPAHVRTALALSVLEHHRALAQAAFPGLSSSSLLGEVEHRIDALYREAALGRPIGSNVTTWDNVHDTIAFIKCQEPTPEKERFYDALEAQLRADWNASRDVVATAEALPELARMLGYTAEGELIDAMTLAAFDGVAPVQARAHYDLLVSAGGSERIHEIAEAIRDGSFDKRYAGHDLWGAVTEAPPARPH